jgi:PAS domain-containing protein
LRTSNQVNVDITERKAAEARLRETDQQFRQPAENISEVFWMSDPSQDQLLFVSPAYEPFGVIPAKAFMSPFHLV